MECMWFQWNRRLCHGFALQINKFDISLYCKSCSWYICMGTSSGFLNQDPRGSKGGVDWCWRKYSFEDFLTSVASFSASCYCRRLGHRNNISMEYNSHRRMECFCPWLYRIGWKSCVRRTWGWIWYCKYITSYLFWCLGRRSRSSERVRWRWWNDCRHYNGGSHNRRGELYPPCHYGSIVSRNTDCVSFGLWLMMLFRDKLRAQSIEEFFADIVSASP